MTAYFDTFRSVVLTPDNVTLLADGVSDTLTINAAAGRGLSLSGSASGTDTLDLNVDYNLFVPIGTSILRLQDVNANTRDITLSAGANITITRNSSSELVLSSTVGGNSKAIGGATAASPVVITTTAAHGFTEGIPVTLSDISGMTQLNGNEYYMDILTSATFALYTNEGLSTPLDGTGFSAYTSGGVATAEYQTTNLAQLGDVLLTSPSVGKVLYHNGAKWIDSIIDTSVITENTNLFYTDTRVDNRFDTRLALKSTTNLAEGTNLYYTDTRANSAIDTRVNASYINTLSGVIADSVDGDLTGSVFGDDSTLLVDGVNSVIPASVLTGTANINVVGNVTGNITGNAGTVTNGVYTTGNATITGGWQFNQAIAADVVGIHTGSVNGTLVGSMSGSVFGDDSALLVDGINGTLVAGGIHVGVPNTIGYANAIKTNTIELTGSIDVNPIGPSAGSPNGTGHVGDGYWSWFRQGLSVTGRGYYHNSTFLKKSQALVHLASPSGTVEINLESSFLSPDIYNDGADAFWIDYPAVGTIFNVTGLLNRQFVATTVTFNINQNATPVLPDLRVDGIVQQISWQNGVIPTATANQYNQLQFQILRVNNGAGALDANGDGTGPFDYRIFGQMGAFSN